MDHNGFVLGAGGSASLPEWQPNQAKQAQRLRKWRKMLGEAFLPFTGCVGYMHLARILMLPWPLQSRQWHSGLEAVLAAEPCGPQAAGTEGDSRQAARSGLAATIRRARAAAAK